MLRHQLKNCRIQTGAVLCVFILLAASAYADEEILYEKFEKCLDQSDFLCAENVLQVAKSQNPEDPAVWNLFGVLRFSEERNVEAIAAFRRAIALDPKRSDARMFLGLAYMKAGTGAKLIGEQWRWVAKYDPEAFRKFGPVFGIPADWQKYLKEDEPPPTIVY